MERDHDKAGTYGAAFASAEAKVRRNASNIYGVRYQYDGEEYYYKDSIDRVEATEVRESLVSISMYDSKPLYIFSDSCEEIKWKIITRQVWHRVLQRMV